MGKRIMGILLVLLCLPCGFGIGGESVEPIFGIDPPNDMSDTLGSPTRRWASVYTGAVDDGQGNRSTPKQIVEAVLSSINRDHNQLTLESRSAPAQHPIGSIQGLIEALDEKASRDLATQASDGLMSASDKTKLDNIGGEGAVYYTPTGEIRLPMDKAFLGTDTLSADVPLIKVDTTNSVAIGDTNHPVVINSSGTPIVLRPDSESESGGTIADGVVLSSSIVDVVRYTEDGNIRLGNNIKLLGADPDDVDHNLIELSRWGIVDIGSATIQTNINSSVRPTVQLAGQTGEEAEEIAFLSDLGGGSGGGAILGEIRLFPFRKEDLPDGWYYPSGDYFEVDSAVGKALDELPETYKEDWGIVTSDSTIRLFDPEKFFSGTMGRFFRPVNGSSRQPGSTEDDAIRNIIGNSQAIGSTQSLPTQGGDAGAGTGALRQAFDIMSNVGAGYTARAAVIKLDASLVVPTAAENRPYNVGLTPAVYLGK